MVCLPVRGTGATPCAIKNVVKKGCVPFFRRINSATNLNTGLLYGFCTEHFAFLSTGYTNVLDDKKKASPFFSKLSEFDCLRGGIQFGKMINKEELYGL